MSDAFRAIDAEGLCDESQMLAALEHTEPPFILGSVVPLNPGDQFTIADHPFAVVRRICPPPDDPGITYIEVTTD